MTKKNGIKKPIPSQKNDSVFTLEQERRIKQIIYQSLYRVSQFLSDGTPLESLEPTLGNRADSQTESRGQEPRVEQGGLPFLSSM